MIGTAALERETMGWLIKIMVLVINVELRNIIRNPNNKCTYKGNILFISLRNCTILLCLKYICYF